MHLDNSGSLTKNQIERIISFASNPATIGYGHRSFHLGLSPVAIEEVHREATNKLGQTTEDDYGFLLHKTFRWADLIENYTVPRDWPATLLDDMHSSCSNESSITENSRGNVTLLTSNTQYLGRSRQIWLTEQSGLQAFYEATETYTSNSYKKQD